MITGAYRSNWPVSRLPPRSVRRYASWASKRSLHSPRKPRDASNDCSIPCRTVWFRSSGLQGLVRLKRGRALLTDRSKPISTRALPWRPLPKGVDVDRICSFHYQATVGNDNAVRLGGIILDIPPGPRHRGYAKARLEVRHLLDGRWRVYCKDQLLLETTPPIVPASLRTLRRRHRRTKIAENKKIANAITKNDRIKSRLTHVLRARDT